MTAMPAINLLVDPMANIVVGVAGMLLALSVTPKASVQTTRLPAISPIVADGAPVLLSIDCIMARASAMV